MSKEEIINSIENVLKYESEIDNAPFKIEAIQGLLDLYNKEKQTSHFLQSELDKANAQLLEEKEKNKELEKKDNTIALLKVMNEELKHDFEEFKKDKDINYLDNNHHKVLVENSMGQTIDEPEECWFDAIEVKIIRNNILYGANIEKDFITLKEISDEHPEECITVIAESPLSGAIYRYNNYGNKEWQLIGSMIGYA